MTAFLYIMIGVSLTLFVGWGLQSLANLLDDYDDLKTSVDLLRQEMRMIRDSDHEIMMDLSTTNARIAAISGEINQVREDLDLLFSRLQKEDNHGSV